MRLIDADELMLRLENINKVIGKSNLFDIIKNAETVELGEQKSKQMFFICDQRQCERCNPECGLTKDIRHAEHFIVDDAGYWLEVR